MQQQFASQTLVKNFLQRTSWFVRPIQKTKWHSELLHKRVDLSSYIVLFVCIVLRSMLSQIIGNGNIELFDILVVCIATVIITLSGTGFFIAIVLIVEWLSGLFEYTKGAVPLLHALILPLLYMVKIEPLVSQTTGSRISLLFIAVGFLIIAFVLRYASAWVLLL